MTTLAKELFRCRDMFVRNVGQWERFGLVCTAANTRKDCLHRLPLALRRKCNKNNWQFWVDNITQIPQKKKDFFLIFIQIHFLPRRTEQLISYKCVLERLLDPLSPVPRKLFGMFLCPSTSLLALLLQGTLSALPHRWSVQEKEIV